MRKWFRRRREPQVRPDMETGEPSLHDFKRHDVPLTGPTDEWLKRGLAEHDRRQRDSKKES